MSDEVRDLLPTALLERVIAHRETTELTCVVCGGTITPENPAPVSVLVRFRADERRPVVQYAHASCAPSKVLDQPVVEPQSPRTTYLTALRPYNPVPAVLLWEPISVTVTAERGQAAQIAAYHQHGFQPSELGLNQIREPLLGQGWVLRGQGDGLVLQSPHGPLEEFPDVASHADPNWLDAVHKTRRCTLVVGELGLDRASFERIDVLLAEGRAVTATVLARLR